MNILIVEDDRIQATSLKLKLRQLKLKHSQLKLKRRQLKLKRSQRDRPKRRRCCGGELRSTTSTQNRC